MEVGLRRSQRDPEDAHLERNDVKQLLLKIRSNHRDTIVLKIKDHLRADVSAGVIEAVIDALHSNKVCQALYMQNLSKGFGDKQLNLLVSLLKSKCIWCLNLGENYYISTSCWTDFCNNLPNTNVTHIYVSEHTIKIDLKNSMRFHIRNNRVKHDKHSSLKNIQIIERCTNMWWNPINAIRHQLEIQATGKGKGKLDKLDTRKPKFELPLTPRDPKYWAEGQGKGGDKPWKFNCICGETCSSYENHRYHPTGAQYECTTCGIWSHVSCVLGHQITEEDLEELQEVHCHACKTKLRRTRHAELRAMNLVWKDGKLSSTLVNGLSVTDNGTDAAEQILPPLSKDDEDPAASEDSDHPVSETTHESESLSSKASSSTSHVTDSEDLDGQGDIDSVREQDGLTDKEDLMRTDSEVSSVQTQENCSIREETASKSDQCGSSCENILSSESLEKPTEGLPHAITAMSISVQCLGYLETDGTSGVLDATAINTTVEVPSCSSDVEVTSARDGGDHDVAANSESTPCEVSIDTVTAQQLHSTAVMALQEEPMSRPQRHRALFTTDATGNLDMQGEHFLRPMLHGGKKALPPFNDLSFSETVFDNDSVSVSEDMRAKKRRVSKGAAFQLNSVVYVPELRRSGMITEEKNGGWKYVKFDEDLRDDKNAKKGKWCRAGEMIIDESAESSENIASPEHVVSPRIVITYDKPEEEPPVASHANEFWQVNVQGAVHLETPFSVPDDFLEAFDNQEYWE